MKVTMIHLNGILHNLLADMRPGWESVWNGIPLEVNAATCLDEIALLLPCLYPGAIVSLTCTGQFGGQTWEYTHPRS